MINLVDPHRESVIGNGFHYQKQIYIPIINENRLNDSSYIVIHQHFPPQTFVDTFQLDRVCSSSNYHLIQKYFIPSVPNIEKMADKNTPSFDLIMLWKIDIDRHSIDEIEYIKISFPFHVRYLSMGPEPFSFFVFPKATICKRFSSSSLVYYWEDTVWMNLIDKSNQSSIDGHVIKVPIGSFHDMIIVKWTTLALPWISSVYLLIKMILS